MNLPDRSTIAAGLGGLAAWGASVGLASVGVPIPQSVLLPITVALMTALCHFVPDAAKVDADIKEVVAIIPQTYSKPSDFPDEAPQDKGTATPNNLS